MPLDAILSELAKLDAIRLIFLDACRDNPLGLKGQPGGTEAGLARAGTSEENTWIGYATQPDAVAFDGGGRNGTFTEALLRHLPTPGISLPEMMMAVRGDVVGTTHGRQIPWEHSSLVEGFAFNPGQETLPVDSLFFQVAAREASSELMELFVERYPNLPQTRDAIALYEQAAKQGFPDSTTNLAVALFRGEGVPRNPARAIRLLTRTANAGSG